MSFSVVNAIEPDYVMEELLKDVNVSKPEQRLNYNYESIVRVPIKLKIADIIETKGNDLYDNQPIILYTRQPVKYKKRIIIKQGEKFTANVAIHMERGMNGIPASIVIDNFKTQSIPSKKIHGVYIKRGFDLSPFVYPLKWALTPIPGVGSLTNLILGGHAQITPNDTITVYYYPEW